MRARVSSVGFMLVSLFTLACGGNQGTGPTGPKITLTQAQAALLVSRVTLIAPVHAELSWLADSANLVLKSGAEADLIDVTTDLAGGPFYAVGLQRAIATSTNSMSTFDIIAFNDPSNPTAFIIVDGFMPGAGTTPPTSASGSFGGSAVTGHLFQVVGSTVSAWRAESGSATLATKSIGGACLGFQPANGVTCKQSVLQAGFTIDVARHDNGVQPADTRSASLTSMGVAGILLSFHLP